MIVRPATAEDISQFADIAPTVRAWAGEINGELVALSGIARIGGRWFIFCDLNDEAKKYKMTIARNAHRVMDEIRKMGVKFVYARIDEDEPRAIAWIATLGFEPDTRTNLYRWRA